MHILLILFVLGWMLCDTYQHLFDPATRRADRRRWGWFAYVIDFLAVSFLVIGIPLAILL